MGTSILGRCLSAWLSAVQATRWPGVSWAKPENSEERIVETISDIPEAGFGGRAGVGVVFHRLWLRQVSANHKHKYRRDCLDSPMCVLNIKNLQGVNKCFMWNWKTERRKDEVPDPRKQALRWGSKANHRLYRMRPDKHQGLRGSNHCRPAEWPQVLWKSNSEESYVMWGRESSGGDECWTWKCRQKAVGTLS